MASSKKTQEKDSIQLRMVKFRFVYQGGVKGEWVNGLDFKINSFITPHPDWQVLTVEIEEEERPPRIRLSIDD